MSVPIHRRSFLIGTAAIAATMGAGPVWGQGAPGTQLAHGFGWVRDRLDPRDRQLRAPAFANPAPRPKSKDLSSLFPPAYDQMALNSCTANAISAAVQYARRVHRKPDDFIPSRLFIYFMERKMEGTIYTDFGAQIRDGIVAVATTGVPPEDKWPYDGVAGDPTTGVFPQNARAIQTPPPEVMQEAVNYKTISYAPLNQSADVLETCVAAGYPFIFGFTVFDNFNEQTKTLRMPGPNDRITPYGHAVLVTGYDQTKRTFRVRNSWGASANAGGYFDMDYAYVLDPRLSTDFWVVYQTLGFL